ncbi:hypothetical protein NPIL_581971 [Nephila pilipes]|uniref:Uncharacterized protein n=1 Tax=Nephila pilipes TaxID=299642 RepID=A0A8X6QMX3_NEPPI|nr:hypothetical protein NPIL_581971 [Nephila pilipes]
MRAPLLLEAAQHFSIAYAICRAAAAFWPRPTTAAAKRQKPLPCTSSSNSAPVGSGDGTHLLMWLTTDPSLCAR